MNATFLGGRKVLRVGHLGVYKQDGGSYVINQSRDTHTKAMGFSRTNYVQDSVLCCSLAPLPKLKG